VSKPCQYLGLHLGLAERLVLSPPYCLCNPLWLTSACATLPDLWLVPKKKGWSAYALSSVRSSWSWAYPTPFSDTSSTGLGGSPIGSMADT
jgi:hypothetical protein